jgi:hypothetical protein
MYQILEVGDEWNILNCIVKGYKIFPITQAILEKFLVNSLFHYTKISTMDMKVLVYSNFSQKWEKNEISKLHEEWGFTLPSIGARFKKLEKKLSKGFSQASLFLLPTFLD